MSGHRVSESRLQAQWPLRTISLDDYPPDLGLRRAHSASQTLISGMGDRPKGKLAVQRHAAEVRRRVRGELKRIERQIVNAGLMPDD